MVKMYFPFKFSLKRAKKRKETKTNYFNKTFLRLSITLKKFLKFCKFEPCDSFEKNSYKKNYVFYVLIMDNEVYTLIGGDVKMSQLP